MSPKPSFSGVSRRLLLSALAVFPTFLFFCSSPGAGAARPAAIVERRAQQTGDHRFRRPSHAARRAGFRAACRAHRHLRQRRDACGSEQPMYVQLAFALDRVKAMAPLHPEWKDKQPFKAVLEGDMKTLAASASTGWRNWSWRPMPA